MERLKRIKLLIFSILICSIFALNINVYAASATVEFSGNSTVSIGEQITVTMYINNVSGADGGIVSAGGNLSFDSSYLQYVSGTGVSTPYAFQINTGANYKLAGLDTSLSNGINSKTKVFTFVFKALKEGSTTVTLTNATLTDTAQKVTTTVSPKTISITQPVPKSNDATLKALSVSGYTISPSFSASTTSYSINVPAGTSSVTINATANHSAARVSGTGKVNLSSDKTNATVKVTAEDGTVKNYTVTINREAAQPSPSPSQNVKSSDATLKSLDVSGYTLSPSFKSSTTSYSIKVANSVTGLNIDAVANHAKATVNVSGNNDWVVGNNTVTIKVTAEDGTVKNYTLNVNREAAASTTTPSAPIKKSSDNYLKSLVINSTHDISMPFDKNVTNYNITVPNEVADLDFKANKNHSKAYVTITGDGVLSTDTVNVIQIKVTAEDGSIRIYTLNVTRSAFKSKAYLKDLRVNNGVLTPNFSSEVFDYNVSVNGKVKELDITAVGIDPNTKVDILGNSNLKEGNNSVLIKVTDENNFTQVYSLNVEKEKAQVTIFGLTALQFGIILFIILLLLALIIYLIIKLNQKEEKEEVKEEKLSDSNSSPVSDSKPKINFNFDNDSDAVIVYGGVHHNESNVHEEKFIEDEEEDFIPEKINVSDINDSNKLPYDLFDDVVTKDELYDAMMEAKRTDDSTKLDLLLEQEKLNRKKQELLKKEQEEKDEWR